MAGAIVPFPPVPDALLFRPEILGISRAALAHVGQGRCAGSQVKGAGGAAELDDEGLARLDLGPESPHIEAGPGNGPGRLPWESGDTHYFSRWRGWLAGKSSVEWTPKVRQEKWGTVL